MARNRTLLALSLSIAVVLAVIALLTFLIMIIWNNVLMKKLRGWNMQRLSFWDALWLAVFFGVLGSASGFFSLGRSGKSGSFFG